MNEKSLRMNESLFKALLQELMDENPFAVRAVLKILDVQFTDKVPTLAVTREKKPRMLVNLQFLQEHCKVEEHVKAVITHEFLHVLLGHTEDAKPMTPARHLAMDAVINAIIHRQLGHRYSWMMTEYYREVTGVANLLKPYGSGRGFDSELCENGQAEQISLAWKALYDGRLVVDDIEALVNHLEKHSYDLLGNADPHSLESLDGEPRVMLGNHDALGEGESEALAEALDKAMQEMNGEGIWRSPKGRGVGANPYEAIFNGANESLLRWERKTLAVLKRHLLPDRNSRSVREAPLDYRLPVLSPGDRRAFVGAMWMPFLPEAQWHTSTVVPDGTANVYLDVSGSMYAEMPLVVSLLGRLSRYIKRPFWAFSDIVAPAVIENGQLKAETSGGTSMSCVLEHIAKTRPAAAIVVTDGYIEDVDRQLIKDIAATRFHAIVTRDGSAHALYRAGIPYTQLDEVPA
jgi:hypothetical protein